MPKKKRVGKPAQVGDTTCGKTTKARSRSGRTYTYRCTKPKGHDGPHHGELNG